MLGLTWLPRTWPPVECTARPMPWSGAAKVLPVMVAFWTSSNIRVCDAFSVSQ